MDERSGNASEARVVTIDTNDPKGPPQLKNLNPIPAGNFAVGQTISGDHEGGNAYQVRAAHFLRNTVGGSAAPAPTRRPVSEEVFPARGNDAETGCPRRS